MEEPSQKVIVAVKSPAVTDWLVSVKWAQTVEPASAVPSVAAIAGAEALIVPWTTVATEAATTARTDPKV